MSKEIYDRGLEIRRSVLGSEYVDNALKNADDFTGPLQDLVTEYCWGWAWGREQLSKRDRSLINLAMVSILNRQHELRVHVKGAIKNGVTKEEIREVLLQVGFYGGIPCAVDSFRTAKEALAEIGK